MAKSAWNYYGVKLIYQMSVTGEPIPERLDDNYSDSHTYFEESVMLVHAQSFDHAFSIAEKKALDNTEPYTNMYGQAVETRLIGLIDCFHICPNDDGFTTGTELFSAITPVEKTMSPSEYIMKAYGYALNDNSYNDAQRERYVSLQFALRNEVFSKYRKR
jgi:hypothetical protein